MKEKKWKKAMEEYRMADDKAGYSEAFSKYRHQLFRDYFGLAVLGLAITIFLVFFVLTLLRRYSDKVVNEGFNYERRA